ncbi:MAG: HD domain-containing protein [Actinomycetia bacterium]|nr:HD domain-containing protein [Actinomycetes bacterium]MCP4224582.1 HD domain-containing protein [Actinomycetes bacterium]MCP5034007.1 HD domain-containing protein [Actinomycetes bacterium]
MNQQRIATLARSLDDDLGQRINFLLEIDRLKVVLRRSLLVDGSRFENTAEHSWHLAMAALVLAPHAGPEVDLIRAVQILLVHDIVEIDAGDIYIYDDEGRRQKQALEQAAAERIFSLLPSAEGDQMRALWDEYEQRETPTARFAYAIDRLQPLLLNSASGGISWRQNGIRHSQAVVVNAPIAEAATELWDLAHMILAEAADATQLADDRAGTAT